MIADVPSFATSRHQLCYQPEAARGYQLSPTLPPTREAANGRAREEEEEGRRTRTGGRLNQDRNESDQS